MIRCIKYKQWLKAYDRKHLAIIPDETYHTRKRGNISIDQLSIDWNYEL